MGESDTQDQVIRNLVRWAEGQDNVRAMLLTSTRAVPGGKVDALSDYDVILVVRDVRPLTDHHAWAGAFGEVLVAYWDPLNIDPESGLGWSGNIMQYADGLKIDFSFWPVGMLDHIARRSCLTPELDAGYRVLMDKDGVTAGLPEPTYTGYIPFRPDEATYRQLVNDFFVGVPYVAKCLLRDEILPAKWCLDFDIRYTYLLPMLEWRMECDHSWSVSPGSLGKGLKRYLPPDIWAELEGTWAGAGIEENWTALYRTVALFRRVAREVAACLGYTYPEAFDRRVMDFIREEALRR